MFMIAQNGTIKYQKSNTFLYAMVFSSRKIIAVVFLLILSFLIQPIEQVYGAEEGVTDDVAPVEVPEIVVEELVPESAPVETEPVAEIEIKAIEEDENDLTLESDEDADGGSENTDVENVEIVLEENTEELVDTLSEEASGGDELNTVEVIDEEDLSEVPVDLSEEDADTVMEDSPTEDDIVSISTESDLTELVKESATSTESEIVESALPDEETDVGQDMASTTDLNTEELGQTSTDGADEGNTQATSSESVGTASGSGGSGSVDASASSTESEISESESSPEESDVDVTVSSSTNSDTDVADEATQSEVDEIPVPEETSLVSSDGDNASSDNNDALLTATSTDTASSTDGVVNKELPLATSSLVVQGEHNSSAYQFSNSECTTVGDGSFYCSSEDSAPELKKDGVFSAPDADGDLEIYVRLNGEEQQLTKNVVDDSAPYYDALSERIVWHTEVNDRYQIMSYDMNTKETEQITSETYNNMEPVAYGKLTLWQAWIQNNWEIMQYDGAEVKQLTDNSFHDVAPHMRSGYIVWQSQFEDGWKVSIYDEATGHIEYVDTEAGTKVENPRFVLVYDSTNAAGDVETFGYDPDNKTSFVLGSIPTELPEELPEPDQTGETRALIQSKPNLKSDSITDLDQTPTSIDPPIDDTPTLDLSSSTTTSDSVDVSSASDSPVVEEVTSTSTAEVIEDDVSDIPDLLVPAVETPIDDVSTLDLSASTTTSDMSEISDTSTVEEVIPVVIEDEILVTDILDIPDLVIPPTASSTLP